jgi:hypothetical protein
VALTIILATWEAEIQQIVVRGQPRQIVCETPISKITTAELTGDEAEAWRKVLALHM